MNRILHLSQALKSQFTLDPRTLSFLTRFIFALLDKLTVNLARLGNILSSSASSESNQRRASRFLTLNMHLTGRVASSLKTRGFNFEDSHIANAARLENLLGLLCLAAFWAVQLGELIAKHQPIKRKAHGRRACSQVGVGCFRALGAV